MTKLVDHLVAYYGEPREFRKRRREFALHEIEQFKADVGRYVELAANWQPHENKQPAYMDLFENDYELIGRIKKYPLVANAGRDALHWCKIVASEEQRQSAELLERKRELDEKYRIFLTKCDEYLQSIV
ncbi:hypothetical protein [Thiohalorhabdus denitrificans]|uniref:hypothetical protein n=1 Tax=Thiohalorhabdus denitrificans TaxID=381306 RepID=UPI00115F7B18|nr:hypothetical protein [Thiohalorhabdus denitrificans]